MAKGCFDVQINDFLASCNVCPVAIPEIFVQTQGSGSSRGKGHLANSRIRLLATHSFQLSRDSPESRLVGGITLTIEFLSLAIDRYFSTND